ncbi:MAG: aspartate carbamoyltransferase [Castellaniella sp.]|uniref:aspartate carbamoyltransferase n=1 Tax=Castellaniella sp. TaxID=1955812 RepID=UPI00121506B0|nr:aspartate carbamoyltransferase [Castellaniella sp.]TAN28476.1 MAG: aspartate carbamoyltransferase [Castellaniella sp.]
MRLMMIPLMLAAVATASHAQSTASPTSPIEGMDHMHMGHAAHMAAMAKAQRQQQVSELGKDVMPFSLAATLHVFTKDAEGGVQQVIARDKADAKQTSLIRRHLQEIREQFLAGDFLGPSHIHGAQMPGLAELSVAKPGQISIGYEDVTGGAELAYRTSDPALVVAIHRWFDAQVSDHGKDAMVGHAH